MTEMEFEAIAIKILEKADGRSKNCSNRRNKRNPVKKYKGRNCQVKTKNSNWILKKNKAMPFGTALLYYIPQKSLYLPYIAIFLSYSALSFAIVDASAYLGLSRCVIYLTTASLSIFKQSR